MTTTAKAPRKYLDADHTEVNPEWLEWRAGLKDEISAYASSLGFDPAVYAPEDYDKAIPEDGAWILVLEEPFTEMRDRFRVPVLSMWRARPHTLNGGGLVIGPSKRSSIKVHPKQAVIATPGGDLHLWPHEYQVVTDPASLMSCEGAVIHSLGGEPVLDEDQMWYLQSRGIPRHEAVLLLIDQVANLDYAYVTFPEEVTEVFAGVGQPLWRHVQRNPRPTGRPMMTVTIKEG